MRNGVLFIGQEIITNKAFIQYALREIRKKVPLINSILFLTEKNKDLFLDISSAYETYDNLIIITSINSYATVSKIVATIFEDNLVLKDNILIPSKSSKHGKNSFLISDKHKINVIRTKVLEKIGKPLIEADIKKGFIYVFSNYEEISKKLAEEAKKYEVNYFFTQECDNLYKLCIVNKPYGNIEMFVQKLKNRYPESIIIAQNIFEYLIEAFSVSNKTLTFAESCTGGLLSSMLTSIPGSSNIFKGSVITYSNDIKTAWLGVKKEVLLKHGAVSEEVVEEMLEGALRLSRADYAIAISGIAGPGGDTPSKPVGTVVVGCRGKDSKIIKTKHFKGDRNYIQYQAAMYGIRLLFEIAREELF